MIREELEKLSDDELGKLKARLGAEVKEIQQKKTERHAEMKILGMNKNERKKDPEILRLHGMIVERNREIQEIGILRNDRAMEKKIERDAQEFALMKLEMDRAKLIEENQDVIAARNARAEDRRPGGPVVWFDPLFRNIKGAEKRLIVMMAREIGQARFAELKRIAYWDEHHKNNHYYSSTMFGGRE